MMKFTIAGEQWLDPPTSRVMFQLKNNNGSNAAGSPIYVQPLSWNPAVFFRRARLIVEVKLLKILMIHRRSLTLTDLLPEDDQSDIACEGFGNLIVKFDAAAQAADQRKGYRQTDYDVPGNVNSARRIISNLCWVFSTKISYCLFVTVLFRLHLHWSFLKLMLLLLKVGRDIKMVLIGMFQISKVNAAF